MIDIDELGPESAKSHPGVHLVPAVAVTAHGPQQPRAKQEIDYGRRGKRYIFGAIQATTGEVVSRQVCKSVIVRSPRCSVSRRPRGAGRPPGAG